MNIALIIAGGVGSRMGHDIPKQFINVYDKPILVYTLEGFQAHPLIDDIVLVCVEGWEDIAKSYCEKYNIEKLVKIVRGGNTGQESIMNGLLYLKTKISKDDVVIIHDGIRPMVEKEVLSDVIVTCQKYGNGVTSMPYNEQIFVKDNDQSTVKYIPRETLMRVSTPQAYRFDRLMINYEKAFEKNVYIHGSSYANTLMVEMGERLYFAAGSEKNIKLTTKEDLELFKLYLHLKGDI